jgi:peptide/nickel transport system ATP-binding protein
MLEVRNLRKRFSSGVFFKKYLDAVDDVSFTIARGETLGLVGESGSGKSTVGQCVIRLIEPTEGTISFDSIPLRSLNGRELNKVRPRMQMIFQDPDSSLDPRMTIGQSIAEPFRLKKVDKKEIKGEVLRLIERVGLSPEHYNRYPHEMSGGQNQRAVLARVLALNPDFIVADEPTASLDVSVQAQILTLLKDLKKEYGITMLFISHDLAVIRYMCDRVAVMYRGKIVETGTVKDVFENPLHPYTKLLLSKVGEKDTEEGKSAAKGACAFYPRCAEAGEMCSSAMPPAVEAGNGHTAVCHRIAVTRFQNIMAGQVMKD